MKKNLKNLCMTALLSVVSTAAWALSEVNGFYQIGTAEDFEAFAKIVNGGTRNANAVLTANIDLGATTTQIGIGGDYVGVFNGAGHTITIDLPDRTDGEGPALFRGVGTSGIVQNLKVEGSITTGTSKHTAAIANYSGGIIRNCFVDITITSSFGDSDDASIGGIAGQLNRPAIIDNCLAKIKIVGATTHKCGGLAAWVDAHHVSLTNNLVINDPESNLNYSDGKSAGLARVGDNPLKVVDLETYNADSYNNRPTAANGNNYVTNNWGVDNTGTTVVTTEELASGKVCFQLNSDQSQIRWVQNIGDAFPVPTIFGEGKGQVYASAPTNCQGIAEGEVTFTNTPSNAVVTKHTLDKYGVCTTCGKFNFNGFDFDDPERFDPISKSFLLASANDLFMAESWNRLQNGFRLNLKMVNDITCKTPAGQFIFNASDWSEGNFDGGGHALTIEMTEMGNNASLFPQRHYGTVENLIMHGRIETSGQYWGSISNDSYESAVRNVYSDIDFVSTKVGDNTAGGFFGMIRTSKNVENCVFAGTITLPGTEGGARCARIGGFAGWTHQKTYFKNCAVLGTINGAGDQTLDNDTENSQNIARNPGNVVTENVYVLNPITGNAVSDHDKYTKIENAESVTNGELAFLLNGKQSGLERFYQRLGTDLKPIPVEREGGLVYCVAAEYRCDGTPLGEDITYSNSETAANIPDHTNVDGWCTVCGTFQEDYMTPVDGWYEISNGTQLAWWSNYVAKYPTVKARLTADINMDGKMTRFIPIGSQAKLFVGEFDGQGHTISNLTVSGGDYTGMFGVIGGGADIKNFILDNTCSITGNAFCGVIGGTNGSGKVYITNVGNEGNVTGTAQNVSGIIGVDMNGAADMFITNCYVTGAIKGNRESATICSWSSANSVVKDCWSSATLEGKLNNNSFTRGNTTVTNCYEIEGVGTQNNNDKDKTYLFAATDIANGALCYKLNGDQTAISWYQKLGEGGDAMPKPFAKEGAIVYAVVIEGYRCDGQPLGDVTYTNTETIAVIPDHQFDADCICTVCGNMETDNEGYNKIVSAKGLANFAELVNAGKTDLKARVFNDIDYTAYPKGFIGIDSHRYSGTFDGQMYTITTDIKNDAKGTGLFGSVNNATIKNLVLDGSVESSDKWIGGVAGITRGNTLIENVVVKSTVKFTGEGDSTGGGLCGDMEGAFTVNNCAFIGSFIMPNGTNVAGLASWTGSGKFYNCYVAPVEVVTNNSYKDFVSGGGAGCVNCYATTNNDAKLASGELCYKLNNGGDNWYQDLGTDTYPMPFNNHAKVSYVGEVGYATMYDTTTGYELAGDVKAYVAKLNKTWLELTEIDNVPAETPVILTGSYYNKTVAELPSINIANELKGTAAATEADGTMYILAKPEGEAVGFYKATGTIPAGKAYYTSASGVKAFYFAGEDATGIEMVNGQSSMVNAPIYNLAGQRINKMQKGINIVNGKKVLK